MMKFEMNDALILESKEDIVKTLREIADQIENGQEFGLLNHEGNQGASWGISEDEEGIIF